MTRYVFLNCLQILLFEADENCGDIDEDWAPMLSAAVTGNSCVYESPGCRGHGGVVESRRRAPAGASSWWPADASTSPDDHVVDSVRRLDSRHHPGTCTSSWWPADASTLPDDHVVDSVRRLDSRHHPGTCMWTAQTKDASLQHCHVLADDNWPSHVDDLLLPTSETYKWMTVKRSATKPGLLQSDYLMHRLIGRYRRSKHRRKLFTSLQFKLICCAFTSGCEQRILRATVVKKITFSVSG